MREQQSTCGPSRNTPASALCTRVDCATDLGGPGGRTVTGHWCSCLSGEAKVLGVDSSTETVRLGNADARQAAATWRRGQAKVAVVHLESLYRLHRAEQRCGSFRCHLDSADRAEGLRQPVLSRLAHSTLSSCVEDVVSEFLWQADRRCRPV